MYARVYFMPENRSVLTPIYGVPWNFYGVPWNFYGVPWNFYGVPWNFYGVLCNLVICKK